MTVKRNFAEGTNKKNELDSLFHTIRSPEAK